MLSFTYKLYWKKNTVKKFEQSLKLKISYISVNSFPNTTVIFFSTFRLILVNCELYIIKVTLIIYYIVCFGNY